MNRLDSFMLDILKDKDKDLLIESILEKLTQRIMALQLECGAI